MQYTLDYMWRVKNDIGKAPIVKRQLKKKYQPQKIKQKDRRLSL